MKAGAEIIPGRYEASAKLLPKNIINGEITTTIKKNEKVWQVDERVTVEPHKCLEDIVKHG